MNTNDLPPAAKLACLIEAGRAANPNLEHGRNCHLSADGRRACALGFAALGAGIDKDTIAFLPFTATTRLGFSNGLLNRVIIANDLRGESLDAICQSLREGELAKVPA